MAIVPKFVLKKQTDDCSLSLFLVCDKDLRERMGNKAAASVIHLEKNKVVAQWLQLIDQTL